MNNHPTIDHLSLVTLALSASGSDTTPKSPVSQGGMVFVFGIGTQGITSFEQRLLGKGVGDTLAFSVHRHNLIPEFEHLSQILANALPLEPPFDLSLRITSIREATDLEVVKALAQKGDAGGCGGDCGCGCGG